MGGRVWRALNFDLTLSVIIGTVVTSKWHDNIKLPSILMSPRQVKQLFNFRKAGITPSVFGDVVGPNTSTFRRQPQKKHGTQGVFALDQGIMSC